MRSPKYCMALPNKCMTLLAKWTSTRHLSPLLKTRSYHRGTKTSYLREQGLLVGWKDIVERFECDLICVENKEVTAKSLQLDLFDNLKRYGNSTNMVEINVKLTLNWHLSLRVLFMIS